MSKLLTLKNLNVSLGDKILFQNINLDINEGETYMLLGENGTGKSLLLELIALGNTNDLKKRYRGLKVEGEILDRNNNNLLNPRVEKRGIVYMTQNENFYNNATILSEFQSSCFGFGIEYDEKLVDQLLKYFEIKTGKNKKLNNNLSYGEGKIIHLIANIIKLKNANILLMDEPLNHLSFKNSKRFNDLIIKIKKENPNLAILVVSHCRALSFADKSIRYDIDKKQLEILEYRSYDCFDKV